MAEITYQMVLSTIQTVGLLVGIFYYITTLRNAQKTRELTLKAQEQALETRQAQLYNSIWNQMVNNPYWQQNSMTFFSETWNNADEFMEKFPYGEPKNENTMALIGISFFFEGLVPIIKEGLLDLKYIDGVVGALLINYWQKLEPVVKQVRQAWNEPTVFGGSEYLYNELIRYKNSLTE